jgi:DHA3 family macrolide efflux protein-like MFS transporter
MLALGLVLLPTALFPPDFNGYVAFTVLNVIGGIVIQGIDVPFTAILQSKYPPEKLGSVMGIVSSIQKVAQPIGLLAIAPLLDLIGIEVAFSIGGLIAIIFALTIRLMPKVWRIDRDS